MPTLENLLQAKDVNWRDLYDTDTKKKAKRDRRSEEDDGGDRKSKAHKVKILCYCLKKLRLRVLRGWGSLGMIALYSS